MNRQAIAKQIADLKADVARLPKPPPGGEIHPYWHALATDPAMVAARETILAETGCDVDTATPWEYREKVWEPWLRGENPALIDALDTIHRRQMELIDRWPMEDRAGMFAHVL